MNCETRLKGAPPNSPRPRLFSYDLLPLIPLGVKKKMNGRNLVPARHSGLFNIGTLSYSDPNALRNDSPTYAYADGGRASYWPAFQIFSSMPRNALSTGRSSVVNVGAIETPRNSSLGRAGQTISYGKWMDVVVYSKTVKWNSARKN